MRPALFGLLMAAVSVSATGGKCLQSDLQKFVSNTECNCAKQLSQCLSTEIDLESIDQIQQCFVENGCTNKEVERGAAWYAGNCYAGIVRVESQEDLKKRENLDERADKTTSSTASEKSTSSATTEKSTTATTANKAASTSSTIASTIATTTSDDSTTSTAASTTASVSSTTSASTTASATSSSQTTTASTSSSSSSTSSLTCFVNVTSTATICSYTVTSGRSSSLGCAPTATASSSCAPGVICQTDTAGNDICMLRDNSLTTSGTVVTIVFSIAIFAVAMGIFIMNMKSRQTQKKLTLERNALLGQGSKGVDVPYSSGNGKDMAPLMVSTTALGGEGAAPYPPSRDGEREMDYSPDGAAPRLHPGLSALGQETAYRP